MFYLLVITQKKLFINLNLLFIIKLIININKIVIIKFFFILLILHLFIYILVQNNMIYKNTYIEYLNSVGLTAQLLPKQKLNNSSTIKIRCIIKKIINS